MPTNFELTAPFAHTLPLSLVATGTTATSPTRVSRARMTNPRPTAKPEVRLELIASLRRRIANGTYSVSAMQLADCMIGALYAV